MNELKICRAKSYTRSSVLTIETEIILLSSFGCKWDQFNILFEGNNASHAHFKKGYAHSKVNLFF